MLKENFLDEMVKHCLPETLVKKFMVRIAAKSPNATVTKFGDRGWYDMRQELTDIKCVNTISVYIDDYANVYKIRYELRDCETNQSESLVEPYTNIKQVILTLLYECVYDINECNSIIEDIYCDCFKDDIECYEAGEEPSI
jgi:hypothetical protein